MLTELEKKIFGLINCGCDIRDITKTLNISDKDLLGTLNLIKDNGLDYTRRSVSINGKIHCNLVTRKNKDEVDHFYLPAKNGTSSFTVIADSHYGSKQDSVNNTTMVYENTYKENNKVVLHLGDAVEGYNYGSKSLSRVGSPEEELQYFVDKYPNNDEIATVLMPGNHDYFPMIIGGYDFLGNLQKERADIVVFPHELGYINCGKSKIVVAHKYKTLDESKKYNKMKLGLCGHFHRFEIDDNSKNCIVCCPSVSKIGNSTKGFFDVDVDTSTNGIEEVHIKQKVIKNNKIYNAGEFNYNYNRK